MKKWYVNGEEFDTALEAIDEIMEDREGYFEDDFEDYLRNEYYDSVEICGVYFDAVEALKDLSMSDYDDKFDSWKDGVRDNLELAFKGLEVGEERSFHGYDVEIRDTDAETFKKVREELSALGDWLENSLYAPLVQTDIKNAMLLKVHTIANFVDDMEERITEEE